MMNESEKISFRDYYFSLPTEEQRKLREEFLSRSGLSYPSFYGKLHRKKYRPLERNLLEELTGETFSWDFLK